MTGREGSEGERAPLRGGTAVSRSSPASVRWMQEGVVLHDASGRIVEATPAACELLGVPEELPRRHRRRRRLRGRARPGPAGAWSTSTVSCSAPEDGPPAITVRTGEPATAVMGVHRPDGTTVWLGLSSVPFPMEEGERPVGASRPSSTSPPGSRPRSASPRASSGSGSPSSTPPSAWPSSALDGTYLEVNPRAGEDARAAPPTSWSD